MRAITLAAGGLACAGAAMTVAAFAGAGGERTAAVASPAPQRDGLAVWVEHGCGSCHRFAPAGSVGPIGPDLTHSLRGKDRAYVERAIVAPDAEAPAGYGTGGMPEDFATRIRPPDLDKLVDYLVAAQ